MMAIVHIAVKSFNNIMKQYTFIFILMPRIMEHPDFKGKCKKCNQPSLSSPSDNLKVEKKNYAMTKKLDLCIEFYLFTD